jgi:hypothetical protein
MPADADVAREASRRRACYGVVWRPARAAPPSSGRLVLGYLDAVANQRSARSAP